VTSQEQTVGSMMVTQHHARTQVHVNGVKVQDLVGVNKTGALAKIVLV